MKQLRINYRLYDQHEQLLAERCFTTTYYHELPPGLLKSALNLINGDANPGYYTITDITSVDVEGEEYETGTL